MHKLASIWLTNKLTISYVISQIIFFFIIIPFYFVISYNNWLVFFGCSALVHLVVSMCFIKKAGYKIFSLFGFFLFFSYVFHLGQLFIKAISPNYKFFIVDYSQWIQKDVFRDSTIFSILIISFVIIGAIFNKSRKPMYTSIKEIRGKIDSSFYRRNGFLILIFTLPFRFYVDGMNMYKSIISGYMNIYNLGINGIVYQLSSFAIIGIYFLLVSYKNDKLKANIVLIIYLVYSFITLFSGSRAKIIISVLLIVYIYFMIFNMFSKKFIVIFAGVGILSLISYNAITVLRSYNGFNFIDIWNTVIIGKSNPILRLLEEFGSTSYTVTQAMKMVPQKIPFALGSTYIYSMAQIGININGLLSNLTYQAQFAKQLTEGVPMGGSYIAELYFNFGYLSTVLAMIVGFLVGRVSDYIELLIKNEHFIKLSYLLMLYISIIWWVRAGFVDFPRSFVWGSGIIYISIKIVKYIEFKYIHKR